MQTNNEWINMGKLFRKPVHNPEDYKTYTPGNRPPVLPKGDFIFL
jgi:hypothetical protein